mmetsp:Transcript_8429/g.14113  ORF Transcript_8429/g.14113 Transcript_8429/m.14113 type:complete len:100 (+) Transcript_8429:683-982(+)
MEKNKQQELEMQEKEGRQKLNQKDLMKILKAQKEGKQYESSELVDMYQVKINKLIQKIESLMKQMGLSGADAKLDESILSLLNEEERMILQSIQEQNNG